MSIEQEKMIVESLSSIYPMQKFEEDAIETVLDALPSAQSEPCEDAVSREAVKELAYSQIRSMYCGVALKEQRETMLRIADNVIGLLAPVASKQPEIVRCKDCKYCVYSPATPNAKRPCDPPQPERWHCYKNRDFRPLIMPTDFCSKAESREVTE